MKLNANLTSPPVGAVLTLCFVPGKKVIVEWGKDTSLKVSPILTLDSSVAISRYLARLASSLELYGSNVMQRTRVDHWLSFSVGPLSTSNTFETSLQYLNTALSSTTFLVGHKLTIADLNVFATLLLNPNWTKLIEKDNNFINARRWFTFISNIPEIKSALEALPEEVIGKSKNKKELSVESKEEGKFISLPGAEMGKVVVRFPPEASGYLHIGHAKAALLNWHYRELFNGKLIMRFDDTNPDKEKVDFEKVILEDLRLLEIYPDVFTHTSDHFPLLLQLCEGMLKSGSAYVDDTSAEQMKAEREARTASSNRSNGVDRNLSMWMEMVNGTDFGQKCCVRAKIDMNSDNGCMRDPTIYRCKNEPHPKTGTKYKVYPTYDFACPIVDSIEGVTHALRTMEYHDRDEQYYWFIDVMRLRKPHIWEYSRLNMMNTVLSKRKLTWFVDQGLVDSWEDARFPTVRGVIRRGMTVQGLKQFIIAQGSSRSVVQMEWDKIWAFNKKVIDPIAPRYMALQANNTVVVNVKGASLAKLTVAKHPKNDIGTKTVYVGPEVVIASDDVSLLKEGENATFINWGNLMIKRILRDSSGAVKSIDADLNLSNTDYKKTPKLTWLCRTTSSPLTDIQVLHFDNIITKPVLSKDDDFKLFINKNSKKTVDYVGDSELASLKAGDVIQLQRIGFFRVDSAAQSGRPLVLIYIPDGSKASAAPLDSSPSEVTPITDKDVEEIAAAWRQDLAKHNSNVSSCPLNAAGSMRCSLSDRISEQGDKVRQLKADKASKEQVTAAVQSLLALKKQFKEESGVEWAASVPPSLAEKPPMIAKPLGATLASDPMLSKKISEQGNVVRQLKASKAAKEDVSSALQILLALKEQYKQSTGTECKPADPSPQPAPKAVASKTAVFDSLTANDLLEQITVQGDAVRNLKTIKANKDEIQSAVNILLTLKQNYKNITGKDWSPNALSTLAAPPKIASVAQPKDEFNSASVAEESQSNSHLNNKIILQGEKVRNLKLQKADKSAVDEQVKILLALKAEYKAATGIDWKPSPAKITPVAQPKENSNSASTLAASPKVVAEETQSNSHLNNEIISQGEKVRNLKLEKADKSSIDEQVKILLALKAEYKAATGLDWKPPPAKTTPVVQPKDESNSAAKDGAELSSKITCQGDKIRDLKSSKADKAAVDSEVKILLTLKADYKNITGQDWKPAGNLPLKTVAPIKKATEKKQNKSDNVDGAKGGKKNIKLEKVDDEKGIKKQTRLGLEAKKEDNLSDWYSQVITKGEMIEYYDVSGCYILRPWAFAIWEGIQGMIDREIKKMGVVNAYFPMFVSRTVLEKEKNHIADFAPEVAWVTKSGDSDLAEHIAIRPTSETVMYPAYSKWIQSHRDLPMRLNQWNNVVRWEFKHPQPFLRTREFLWQEGHTAFATDNEAHEEVYQILDLYSRVYSDLLAIPVIKGRKTEKEKFAGGDFTTTVEAFIAASGRGIQGATSHHLGQNFSKMFDITVEDPETKEKKYVYQNSWGLTTRTIGVMIMVHSDNMGLVLPPAVAAIQIVIVPCGITANLNDAIRVDLINTCKKLNRQLEDAELRSKLDDRDNYSPGWKFNHWELKGVPLRVELGPKDLEKKQLVAVRRDIGSKLTIPIDGVVDALKQILDTIQRTMFAAAEAQLKDHTKQVTSWDQFCPLLDAKNIILAPFCEASACEDNIKKDSARDQDLEPGAPAMGAKSLCIPFNQPSAIKEGDICIHPSCRQPAKSYTLFGRSY